MRTALTPIRGGGVGEVLLDACLEYISDELYYWENMLSLKEVIFCV
ncbi:hypothetical protein [Crocosphaera sp.]|nr:hypothetical protein [Crocosphaera sp.]